MRRALTIFLRVNLTVFCLVLFTQAQQDEPSSPPAEAQQDKSSTSARSAEESSSKDTRIDLSPPNDDQKNHPMSGAAVSDAEEAASDVQEFHPWDPHKAAKDVEVGDFYFKRKNYRAALERYKEALVYKQNDAIANFRLAECQEKVGNPAEAVTHYGEYLKILPHGPFAADAQKALERLKASRVKESSVQAR
jgi:tetratricopeptide (TPR) repeat protein